MKRKVSLSCLAITCFIFLVGPISNPFLYGNDQEKNSKSGITIPGESKKAEKMDEKAGLLYNLGLIQYQANRYPQALEYFKQSLQTSQKTANHLNAANCLTYLVKISLQQGNTREALDYAERSLVIRKKLQDKLGIGRALNDIGYVYGSLNDYEKAMDYHLQCLSIYEDLGDKLNTGYTLNNIGILQRQMEKYQAALDYHLRALKLQEETGDEKGTALSLNNIGNVYLNMKQYRRAVEYYLQSLELKQKIQDKSLVSTILANTGSAYLNLQQYDRALEYLNESLELAREIGNKRSVVISLINSGAVYTGMKKFRKALEYLEKSLQIAREIEAKDIARDTFHELSDLHAAQGNYKKALEYFLLFYKTDKELLDEKSNRQINELQAKYEAERNAKKIEVLKKNEEINALELSKERVARKALLVGFILVSVILVLVFKKYLYLFAFWKKEKYVGQFRLLDNIGSGAVGTIYKAHSIVDKSRIAAVKILKDELFTDDKNKKRFKREAMLIDRLRHPNIVRIIEIGEYKNKLFLAMEYLPGQSLEQKIINEGLIPFPEGLHIMKQVTDALAYIHSNHIIHRDLKPANIMLIEKDEDKNFVKLLDFGLARTEFQTRLTQPGGFVGTVEYVSPEQILDADSSLANDIFALGVTFYRVLSNQSPFPGESVIDVMRQIIKGQPPRVSLFRPNIPQVLDDLVMNMITKDPNQRPTAPAVLKILNQINL